MPDATPTAGQRQPHHLVAPAIAIAGVEDGNRRQHRMGEVGQEGHARQSHQLVVRAEQTQRSHRVGACPLEGHAAFARQRLGQQEISADGVGKTEGSCDPERQAGVDRTQQSAQCRSQHKADAERRSDQPERAGSLLGRRNVGDVGIGGRETRRRDAGYDAADEQPGQGRCQRHQDIVEAQAQHRNEQHRTAAEAVGHGAQQGRGDELHQGPRGAEQAVDLGRSRRVAAEHALHELGQHGNDDAEGDDIEQDDAEDEGHRGFARLRRRGSFLHGAQNVGYDRR